VEGVDGSGKSTLIRALAEEVRANGRVVCASREPTGGVWGKKIRETARTGRLSIEEELEFFVRDRREHVTVLIEPALQRGEVVLLDRYYFSTAAYQGARGADPEAVLAQNEKFAPRPNLVLLLDCDPRSTLQRITGRGDVPDAFEKLENLQRVREIFLSLKRPYIHVLDASESVERVEMRGRFLLRGLLAGESSKDVT
jgi:dTMP kinase